MIQLRTIILSAISALVLVTAASATEDSRPTYTAYRLASPPTIDGDLSDWPDLEPLFIGRESDVASGDWSGPDDLSASIRIAWDDAAVYFAIHVRDDEVIQNLPDAQASRIWSQDCIQWAIDIGGTGESYDYEYGFGRTQDGPCVYRWQVSGGLVPGRTRQVDLAVKQTDDGLIYEAAVWLGQLLRLDPHSHRKIGFTIVVQDLDSSGRTTLQWTPGITSGKVPQLFGRLIFSDSTAGTANSNLLLSGRSQLTSEPAFYHVIIPGSKTPGEIAWRLVDETGREVVSGVETDRTRSAGVTTARFQINPNDIIPGRYTLDVVVAGTSDVPDRHATLPLERIATERTGKLISQIAALRQHLKSTIAQAESVGIETAYALAAVTVSEVFEPFHEEDLKKNRDALVLRNLEYLAQSLAEHKTDLERQIRDGADGWRRVPRPDMTKLRLHNGEFYVDDEPVMLAGPMTWMWQIYRSRDVLPKLGFNAARIGLEPRPLYDEYGYLRDDIPWSQTRRLVDSLPREGVAVGTTTPLYSQIWQGMRRRGNMTHEDMRSEYASFVELMTRRIGKGKVFLHEIAAEGQRPPVFFDQHRHLKPYQDWLKQEYGSIEEYNRACGTDFPEFSAVDFPPENAENPARKFDRQVFLQRLVSDELVWAADQVRQLDPGVLVAGYPSWLMMDDEGDFYDKPIDAELDLRAFDICDADTAGAFATRRYAMHTIHWLAMYRDLMVGLAPGMAQFDGEFHYVNERRAYPPGWSAAMYFQATVHGMSGSFFWVWHRRDSLDSAVLMDAQVCTETTRAILDLRRLAREMVAFHKAPAKVAILYSHRSTPHATEPSRKASPHHFGPTVSTHLKQLNYVYEGLFFEGFKVGFISERGVEQGRLDQFDMLIVPAATHVSDEVVELVNAYAATNPTVLVGPCFTHDHRSRQRQGGIKSGARLAEFSDDTDARRRLRKMTTRFRPVVQVATSSEGRPCVEWRYARTCDDTADLLYLLNIGHDPTNVLLHRDGEPVSGTDLLTDERIGPNLTLPSVGLRIIRLED